jgi:DNA-binding SARP family transcriptional activator
VEIQLLGNVEIHGNPGPIRLERAGEVAVLAILAFNTGKPVSPAALVDHLWEPPEQTDKSLETVTKYVRTLRVALVRAGGQREWLVYDRRAGTYLLNVNPACVDYHRFTELVAAAHRDRDTSLWEKALALWTGPALGGVTGPWAQNRRHVLDTERLAAYDALLADYLATGRHAEVTRITAMLVDECTPTDQLLLVGARALAGAGRHTAIPGWKQHVTARMRQTVDATPSAEVLDEIDQITAHPTPWHPHPERGPATAMFSLRSDIATFTGRDEELNTLLDTVLATLPHPDRDNAGLGGEGGGVRAIAIHTVDGMPGVGKTTFTVHAAHHLATRFPDGNLFLDLLGHAPGQYPLSPGAALESLLVANGVDPKMIPTPLADRARLWRDRLAGKKVLLVLDDAADHDQVRPLLPGTAGNLVLITSRHRLAALDGVTPLTLDVLPPDQAITLLLRLSGRHSTPDPDEHAGMARIVASCGYLPLAITLEQHLPGRPTRRRTRTTGTPRHRRPLRSGGVRDVLPRPARHPTAAVHTAGSASRTGHRPGHHRGPHRRDTA